MKKLCFKLKEKLSINIQLKELNYLHFHLKN